MMLHTMTEMWDPEPEARISAGVALERLNGLISSSNDLPSLNTAPAVAFIRPEFSAPSRTQEDTEGMPAEMSPLISANYSPETNV